MTPPNYVESQCQSALVRIKPCPGHSGLSHNGRFVAGAGAGQRAQRTDDPVHASAPRTVIRGERYRSRIGMPQNGESNASITYRQKDVT